MGKRLELVGQKFGRLMVEKFSRKSKYGYSLWQTRCDCGAEKTVSGSHLKSGHTKSCGCVRKEITSKRYFKHGMTQSPIYNIWSNMKCRCLNRNDAQYKDYGGRGILICKAWLDSFETFLSDMGEKPEGLSIDRIDNNGNYEPNNCRWSDRYEQNNNARSNVKITYKGKTLNMAQWARELNINKGTLRSRLNAGWSTEKAFGSRW